MNTGDVASVSHEVLLFMQEETEKIFDNGRQNGLLNKKKDSEDGENSYSIEEFFAVVNTNH